MCARLCEAGGASRLTLLYYKQLWVFMSKSSIAFRFSLDRFVSLIAGYAVDNQHVSLHITAVTPALLTRKHARFARFVLFVCGLGFFSSSFVYLRLSLAVASSLFVASQPLLYSLPLSFSSDCLGNLVGAGVA